MFFRPHTAECREVKLIFSLSISGFCLLLRVSKSDMLALTHADFHLLLGKRQPPQNKKKKPLCRPTGTARLPLNRAWSSAFRRSGYERRPSLLHNSAACLGHPFTSRSKKRDVLFTSQYAAMCEKCVHAFRSLELLCDRLPSTKERH